MEIIISGRHVHTDNGIKAFVEEKLLKIADEYAKLTSARVVLDKEKSSCIVDIHLHGKNLDINATSRDKDLFVAIDNAADKIEKQLRKYLDKIQHHQVNKSIELTSEIVDGDDDLDELDYEIAE